MARLPSARTSADACPGALRPHHAADGDLVRLRLPGGALDPAALLALAAASQQYADGRLGLTSRGNLQLRGVAPGAVGALAGAARAAGLLPSPDHELVRNIVASPLSARRPGSLASIDALTADLDAALCLRPQLTGLPGRFLFAVDDGTGDVAGQGADVLLQARGGGLFGVLLGGWDTGLAVPEFEAVSMALGAAEAFLAEREAQRGAEVPAAAGAWRLSELIDGPARVLARLLPTGQPVADHDQMDMISRQRGSAGDQNSMISAGASARPSVEPGLIEQNDGRFAVGAVAPLGLITQDQAHAIAAAAQLSQAPEHGAHVALRITPWRRIVLRDLELPAALAARELLDAAGLVVSTGTAWNRVTACAGQPGCAKALADVHADARDFVAGASPEGPPVHWAGCERGCGTPSGPVTVAIATGQGYGHEYRMQDGEQLSPTEQAWIGAR